MKWILRGAIAVLVILPLLLLDFWLPSGRVVYIVGTEVKRFEADAMDGGGARDVRYITADDVDTRATRVYRNEDAWFYLFKVDSADVQGRAQSLQQRPEPTPALIRYYGWRIQPLSLFNNVVSVRETTPDAGYLPLTRILLFGAYGVGVLLLAWKWRQRSKRIAEERRQRAEREAAERAELERRAAETAQRDAGAVDDFLSSDQTIGSR